jgi:NAD(P)-dependent dehydrogenase (short-subunit alcohol dehydrogenase family)
MTQAGNDDFRFDGRVAVVTGAGGQQPSLGEAYARLLASRGAKVVVNDLGVGPDGTGGLPANAQAIVQGIVDAGGEAIGDTNSVADPASARAVIHTALDAWGRIDILVNNAGIVFFALFEELSENDIRRVVDTHLFGSIWMAKAAWPHLKEAGYGRIVNISSESMFGHAYLPIYGAAKAGVAGLTRGLSLEGARCGITVNAVAPRAHTRKHAYLMDLEPTSELPGSEGHVDQVAPIVAYLCHERCELNGAFLWTGSGRIHEFRTYQSRGYNNPDLTIEDVHASVDRILDQTGALELDERGGPIFDAMPRKPYVAR